VLTNSTALCHSVVIILLMRCHGDNILSWQSVARRVVTRKKMTLNKRQRRTMLLPRC